MPSRKTTSTGSHIKKKRIMIRIGKHLPLVLLLATVSCTVLEDRVGCPNFLVLDLDYEKGRSESLSVDCRFWIDGALNVADTVGYRIENHAYEFPFKDQGMAEILCLTDFGGNADRIDDSGDCIIPLGQEHIPFHGVYIQSQVETSDVYINGRTLNKQYCNLKFTLSDVPFPTYTVAVVSDVCGFNARTLLPIEGEFRYQWNNPEYSYNVCIPRQLDDGILDIVIHDNRLSPMARETDIILHLGAYIKALPYEWSQPDVADITAQMSINEDKTVIQLIQ